MLYVLGHDAVEARLRLAEAAQGGEAAEAIERLRQLERPVFPLKGRDLIAAGLERGPELGELLGRLEQVWIDSGFSLDRKALLDRAKGGAA